jgi:hypothetical protein
MLDARDHSMHMQSCTAYDRNCVMCITKDSTEKKLYVEHQHNDIALRVV